MCDYSLTGIRNRLAVEGERLVVHRFHTGAVGLASPADLGPAGLSRWRSVLYREETACAVCIPPGARLVLRDIPERRQVLWGVRPEEEVIFVQLSLEAYQPRDAVRFGNGREILLRELREGQRVEVLSLAPADAVEQAVNSVAPAT
jgi:hypothetical protein